MRDVLDNFSPSSSERRVFGQRVRYFRRRAGLTLEQVGSAIGRPASFLSQVENGHREPRLSTISDLAAAIGCAPKDLLDTSPPDRRAELELRLEAAQDDPRYKALRLPWLRPSARTDDLVLRHLVALSTRLGEVSDELETAPLRGGGARAVNAAIREEMRRRDNYYAEIEAVADAAVRSVDLERGAGVSERGLAELAAHFGFTIARVVDLPPSTRSVTDQRARVIYIPQRNNLPTRVARSVVAQTLGHYALGHNDPDDFAEYVRQRVEANYFAGALFAPERTLVPLLRDAKAAGDIAVEDVRDVFYVSYEMAAHRLTNLVTHHLDIPVHFHRTDAEGIVWKAYENDAVPLPTGPDGAVEGQRVCRRWSSRQAFESEDAFRLHYQVTETPAGAFWCVTNIESDGPDVDAITVGTPEAFSSYFRSTPDPVRAVSHCPDPACCRQPRAEVAKRWEGRAWASARDRSQVVSGLPGDGDSFSPFPGVDLTDVYNFLDRHHTTGGRA